MTHTMCEKNRLETESMKKESKVEMANKKITEVKLLGTSVNTIKYDIAKELCRTADDTTYLKKSVNLRLSKSVN